MRVDENQIPAALQGVLITPGDFPHDSVNGQVVRSARTRRSSRSAARS